MMRTLPDPVGVGYFPKRTARRPEQLQATIVEEICSVSDCISKGPTDWVNKWLHNDLCFYDTESLAWQAVGEDRAGFEVYAYKVYPLQFDNGEVRPWAIPIHPALDLGEYTFIGFDLVNRISGVATFGCSALSCNYGATEFQTNKFCLMDELEAAFQACLQVSKGKYEPGPYFLFQIFRQKRGG